jgi:hypothetical protein
LNAERGLTTHIPGLNGPPTTNAIQDANKSLPPTPGVPAQKSGADQKKEMMERLQPKGKPIDAAQRKGERWELDPTTKQNVLIKDPSFERESAIE